MENEKQIKQFILLENSTKKKVEPVKKERAKRVITATNKWTCEPARTPEQELAIITQLAENTIMDTSNCALVLRLIQGKVSGYRSQDVEKKLLNESALINSTDIIGLLTECKNICYYCQEPVQLFYEYVREPKQWTLDRIDNDFGHNRGNVLVACLQCNLRRRTMYHERYVFTKQLTITRV